MDLTNHSIQTQQQQHQNQQPTYSNRQQAQQQPINSSQSNVNIDSPGQLPDESYIERLFPKCQPPKQTNRSNRPNATTSNHRNLGDRLTGSTIRQPNRRQTRTKMHSSLHRQEQESRHSTRGNLVETSQDDIYSGGYMSNGSIVTSNINTRNGTKISNKKCNDVDYYHSTSESSETETHLSTAEVSSRRGSKQSTSLNLSVADESQVKSVSQKLDRPARTRRYKAAKNLQPRCRRSQSNHVQLNAQTHSTETKEQLDYKSIPELASSPAMDSITSDNAPVSTQASTPPTSIPVSISCQQNLGDLMNPAPQQSDTSLMTETLIKTKNEKPTVRADTKTVNRTCRGIVFSDSVPALSSNDLEDEKLIVPASRVTAQPLHNKPASTIAPAAQQVQFSVDSFSQQQSLGPQILHQDTTADLRSGGDVVESEKTSVHASSAVPIDFYNSSLDHAQDYTNIPKSNDLVDSTDKLILQDDDQLKDDDKYINLFVYDNVTPQRKMSETDCTNAIQSDYELPQKLEESNSQRDDRKLFTGEFSEGEEDMIRNDTSIDELCNLNDGTSDASGSRSTQSQPIRESDNRANEPEEVIAADENTMKMSSTNRPYTKPHRSLVTTLQTVDEKAEICNDNGVSDSSCTNETLRTELIDMSDSGTNRANEAQKLLRRGGPPQPGFPRQVRPQPHQQLESSGRNPNTTLTDNHLSDESRELLYTNSQVANSTRDSHLTIASNGRSLMSPFTEESSASMNHASDLKDDDPDKRYIGAHLADTLGKEVVISKTSVPETTEANQLMHPSQHHKLPNETKHFSILRTVNKPISVPASTPEILRSKLQFSALSDADSELDDQPNLNIRPSCYSAEKIEADKKLDKQVSYSIRGQAEDEVAPTSKTALIFPRLDEGLSSDAESCADEVDDDEDRAIEADVDADDEEGNEDDLDSPIRTIERVHGTSSNGNESFLRDSQSMRTSARFSGSVQQMMTSGNISTLQNVTDIDIQQIKQTSTPQFPNYMTTGEVIDQNDIKTLSSFPAQNGQPNYWMGVNTQTNLSTQQASTQQFQPQRSQHQANTNNGNNLSRSNSYVNRDEAKAVNRFSSDTDNETDRLLGTQRNEQLQKTSNNDVMHSSNSVTDNHVANNFGAKQPTNSREVLIEGVLFNVKYLGSTHTECEGRGEKEDRIHQAELAVHEVKFRNGDPQIPIEVQLFISTEKIMVLDDKHRKIMMDHSLRTISYIADIGDAIVLIVRKKSTNMDPTELTNRPISKTSCHVFESNESHTITKSISQAFQVAYTELLKANGSGDSTSYLPKELDYQEVLNSQEMSTTELEMFARKDNQREVIVPKQKGEILGLSIVESGWGSVLPTAVIASLKQDSPAYRCKKLSVGDQILSINGISLVGLSLAECQKILRKTKNQSVARLSVVPCPITVEVKIKRPDTKYQLGFSVQHGVICSLLRGGIAERGGVRVGHRIISINGTTVVGVPHDKIVTLLASSVGEIRMKTCLTSLYRHMLGEEKNVSFV